MSDKKVSRRREPLPSNPDERFKVVASKRAGNVVSAINSLRSITGHDYNSTPEQRAAVIEFLRDAVNSLEDHFGGKEVTKGLVL